MKNLFRDKKGSVAIEFGLLSPFLALFTLCTADLARLAYFSMETRYAAQAGAIYAVQRGFDAAGIEAAIRNASRFPGAVSASPAPETFKACISSSGMHRMSSETANCDSGAPVGTYVTVHTSAAFKPIMNISFFHYPASLVGRVTVRIS